MTNLCGCDREKNIICDFHLDQAIAREEVRQLDREEGLR